MSEAKVIPQTSRLAVAALVLGVVTFIALLIIALVLTTAFSGSNEFNDLVSVVILVFPLSDLATLALSAIAWRRVQKSEGRLKGRGLALGGLILDIVTLALLVIIFVAASLHGPTVCSPPAPPPGHAQPPC